MIRRNRYTIKRVSIIVSIMLYVTLMLDLTEALAYIPPGVSGSNLYADYVIQEKSNWCWVACAQNATIQEGCNTMNQYNAVYILKGQTPNFYPNVGGSVEDTEAAAELMCGHTLNYVGEYNPKTYSFLCDKIYNGHSVIAGYVYISNGSTCGHMVLLMGWDTSTGIQRVKFFDPNDGHHYSVSYSSFCSGMYNGSEYVSSVYVN